MSGWVGEISAVQLHELSQTPSADFHLIDVREDHEVAQGMIAGALHIPLGLVATQTPLQIPNRQAKIITYCRSGVRSVTAGNALLELGYSDVTSMAGGIIAWRAYDFPTVVANNPFSEQERQRYQHHLQLPQIGIQGQARLKAAQITLLGAGGLGSAAAYYLAAAGIGKIKLIDHDTVELSNLQRQILHNQARLGQNKVTSAQQTLSALNPDIEIIAAQQRLTADNATTLIAGSDLVVDGCDNLESRWHLSAACAKLNIPHLFASVEAFSGQLALFHPPKTPCYRCLFPHPLGSQAPSCAQSGVVGAVPGILGVLQAMEAIKYILQLENSYYGKLLHYNALQGGFSTLKLQVEPCSACQAS